MAKQSQAPSLALAHSEDEPLVFYGQPGAVRGGVRLHNPSDEKVKLYSIPLETSEIRGPGGEPLRSLQLSARLYAQQQATVPARLQVDPSTPPGTYEVSLRFGDVERTAVVHVIEKIDLRLEPSNVSLYTEGEYVFEREFVLENAGNVPLRIGPKCLAPLVDSMEVPVALRRGLEDACEQEPAEVLRSFLCAWSQQQVGNVSLTREDFVLEPGETRIETGTFTLPDDLQSFRRYDADMALYNATLHLTVYTGDLREKKPGPEKRRKR